ncbi:MAG TPA: hypothetical protein VG798_02755 [Rhizomicrobium sp.]|jgi:hypothetical protein|nr:hypothetical protein [Rhizomicrobium sp.]
MRRMIALFLLLSAGTAQALDISALTHPGVTWQTGKARTADVTCDGKADTVLFGTAKNSVWVGILPGDGGKPQTMHFPIASGKQNGFCAEPKNVTVSPISCSDPEMGKFPGCKAVKGCQDFTVADEECDSFHFYWDANKRMIRWWRR